jgi:hypothetical protein
MSDIHHIVRKTFVLQYSNFDYLNDFRKLLISHIKLNNYEIVKKNNQTILIYENKEYIIPNTPKLGDFDIKQIELSSYIICYINY